MPRDDMRRSRPRTQVDHEAAIALMERTMRAITEREIPPKCDCRGLSNQTTQALVKHGIDAPQRLLFMTETNLKNIPGISMRYRAQFIPGQ